MCLLFVFTTRCYASMAYAIIVCLSICLSQASIVPKRLNIGSCKQRHMIDSPGTLVFLMPKISAKLQRCHPLTGAPNRCGV